MLLIVIITIIICSSKVALPSLRKWHAGVLNYRQLYIACVMMLWPACHRRCCQSGQAQAPWPISMRIKIITIKLSLSVPTRMQTVCGKCSLANGCSSSIVLASLLVLALLLYVSLMCYVLV